MMMAFQEAAKEAANLHGLLATESVKPGKNPAGMLLESYQQPIDPDPQLLQHLMMQRALET